MAFRLAIGDREAARRSLARILEWDFDRIFPGHGEDAVLPGHGETVDAGGRRAFEDDLSGRF
jgi:glyoxylase-like metal-dependent hydrolase (beta-lactamase superfamily II)